MKSWQIALRVSLLLLSMYSAGSGTLAQFRTAFGDIEMELYDQDKPVTVQNFVHYIQTGRYQDEFAHRLVPGFVVQGGGFTVTNGGTTNWNIVSVLTDPPITNEFAVGRRFSNVYGTIAMAKAGGNTNSATSQWFINLANNSFLDAADTNNLFVVFGHIVSGTNVLNVFSNFHYWTGIQNSNLVLHQYYQAPFDDLPLLRPSIIDTNFLFVDITLLQVSVKSVAGSGKEISWNSATGMTNIVEFTTNFPPLWYQLFSTNGNGSTIKVTDDSPGSRRFYRVRVNY
ncbi:MAG: peptidylprolyl isomerase [Verrucomicrobia bacterium]|nr:peptidylprolyl isomerase [Verrucomicrobiota bacterium]